MNSTQSININIRMNKDLKNQMDELCEKLGLTVSGAFTIFAKAMVRRQGIPFDVALPSPNIETLAAFSEVEDMKKHPEKYKTYSSAKELIDEVLTDDV